MLDLIQAWSLKDSQYKPGIQIICTNTSQYRKYWNFTALCVSIIKLDGRIVWNATIQYSARRGRLSVNKLFASCIRRCLLSRACD